ncbi:MarR family winged helix-turn-helix transcriptional regulator [Leptothermofonsia sp. ETS-13]|uniref:MarR family winged helix-turn-helix transcriptional regulator n=1 Tax=Leptothermofonsia sp. ETS-13 TaxID=3035696 RepID=UPI003B9E7C6B
MSTLSPHLDKTQLLTAATFCTCMNVRKASRVITQLYDEALQPSGLLVSQFNLLVALAFAGSMTMTRLAEVLVMDRTTLTRNLKPLERDGLVQIQPGQDQRTRVVNLTQTGRAALATALPLWEKVQASVVERLGQEQWSLLLQSLSQVVSLDP